MQGISLLGPLLQREITVFVLKKSKVVAKVVHFCLGGWEKEFIVCKKRIIWAIIAPTKKKKVIVSVVLSLCSAPWEKESYCIGGS